MASQTDVFIVGAGPVDKLAEVPKWGRADNISPRNMEIFSKPSLRLIGDELESISHKVSFMSSFENGVNMGNTPLADKTCRYKAMNTVQAQSTIQSVLEHRLRELGVLVERRSVVSDLKIDDNIVEREGHPVTLTVDRLAGEDDHIAETRCVQARYVIAADGARSSIRKMLGITFDAFDDGVGGEYHSASMDIKGKIDIPNFDKSLCIMKQEEWGTALVYPKNGLMKVGVMLNDDSKLPLDRSSPQEKVFEKLKNILHPFVLDIEEIKFYTTYTIKDLTASAFAVKNRVFLVGDSIHIQSPKTGQGLNLGFGDAYNLFWKLHLHHQGLAPSHILDTYSKERREVAKGVKVDAAAMTKVQGGAIATKGDSMGKQVLDAAKRTKRVSLGVAHGENAINSVGLAWNPVFPLLPGKRAPNGMLGREGDREVWLYDRLVIAYGIYVLIFVADPRSDPATIDSLKAINAHLKSPASFLNRFRMKERNIVNVLFVTKAKPLAELQELAFLKDYPVVVDETGVLHEQYGINERTKNGGVFVLRPDDVVGGAVLLEDFKVLEEYFDGFLISNVVESKVSKISTTTIFSFLSLFAVFLSIAYAFTQGHGDSWQSISTPFLDTLRSKATISFI
ncbi:FAD binding domain-containing protein [Endogone sp. FLAS-F59071]|nr:FAD binding domain-containing protein [Endogone sp. FLAS-F59071]|eukprot:RUS14004.1 FAD binding domain-containing protein [Endogone sp. FLAS-F59071]